MYHKFIILLLFSFLSSTLQHISAQEVIRGRASYYSDRLHGRRMSNGQKYHRDSLTCAHRKLPFGTRLRVKNVSNGKEVTVTVTDRGPYSKRFILDLSRAAATQLGIIRAGHCMCEIIPIQKDSSPPSPLKPKDEEMEVPELDLTPDVAATYPQPVWQPDTITNSRATVLPLQK